MFGNGVDADNQYVQGLLVPDARECASLLILTTLMNAGVGIIFATATPCLCLPDAIAKALDPLSLVAKAI